MTRCAVHFEDQILLRNLVDIVVTLLLLGSVGLLISWMSAGLETEYQGKIVIIDGDSVILEGEKIRLEGIDAPEMDQVCSIAGVNYQCGRKSRKHMANLVKRREMRCTAWQRDKYERLLGHCFVGKTDINAQMVMDGWALSFGGYFGEEAQAKKNRAGIWAGKFQRPRDWRRVKSGSVSLLDAAHKGKPQSGQWWKFW